MQCIPGGYKAGMLMVTGKIKGSTVEAKNCTDACPSCLLTSLVASGSTLQKNTAGIQDVIAPN